MKEILLKLFLATLQKKCAEMHILFGEEEAKEALTSFASVINATSNNIEKSINKYLKNKVKNMQEFTA